MKTRTVIVIVALLSVVAFLLLLLRQPEGVKADEVPSSFELNGVVRDFGADHSDFGIATAHGHCAMNVSDTLPSDRRPTLLGTGRHVVRQWYDKDGNPIRPYVTATDRGLPGGHFDVDVFDEATTKQEYHKHQFDDAYDVTYADIAHDPKLLFDDIIGAGYPNEVRVEFFNAHNGSGTYRFDAGSGLLTGRTSDGFTTTFRPSDLALFRLDFVSLAEFRGTQPGEVQGDVVRRDGALSVRMYDVTTNALVYELSVYEHVKSGEEHEGGDSDGAGPVATIPNEDACGDSINDVLGTFGEACGGDIADAASFGQWFRDALGTNLSKSHGITLHRNPAGVYEYLTDDFFPIDDELLGNEGSRNEYFTYSFSAPFTYSKCTGQFFEFEGNDDAWVFIDERLAIDLGGTGTPARQYVALDRFELVDGETYMLRFFYARRRSVAISTFNMRTNILLGASAPTPVSGSYD